MKLIPLAKNYAATACGAVVNLNTGVHRKPDKTKDGYLKVTIFNKSQFVHRLVASAFFGQIPAKQTVNHKNFCKSFNFCTNLEICTRSQNTQHAISNGRFQRSTVKRLSKEQVEEIKRLVIFNKKQDVAVMFGVKPWTISRIITGVIYGST